MALAAISVGAQMTPNAPVKNFRFPRFGEEGFTQWVLSGGKGIYDSEEQIRVQNMGLRVYSGDERMALEMSLESPAATLRLKENTARSDASIAIDASNFEIEGRGWDWDGDAKVIVVRDAVTVRFAQALVRSLTGENGEDDGDGAATLEEGAETVIQSDFLRLKTTEDSYEFEFETNVRVRTEGMDLECRQLQAWASAPEGRDATEVGEIEGVRRILARDDVVIRQENRTARAAEAEFLPAERVAYLRGSPEITTESAFASGREVTVREGRMLLVGGEAEGRAQMILSEAGGLGIQGSDALSGETVILGDSIELSEEPGGHVFRFDGSVVVMSGEMQLASGWMRVETVKATDGTEERGESGDLRVGEVREAVAGGEVVIERGARIARSEKAVFHPGKETAELSGSPSITDGPSRVEGARMRLFPEGARVDSEVDGPPVTVTLPVLPDLGYAGENLRAEDKDLKESRKTVIRSQVLEMEETPDGKDFHFREKVDVEGTNLRVTCGRMDVMARAAERGSGRSGASGVERLAVQRIVASDSVEIEQAARHASADQAVVHPREGRIVLHGSPVVRNDDGQTFQGFETLTVLQGERRVRVEGGDPESGRSRLQLPGLKVEEL